MYAAIGGLKTHMSNLNVIGNKIANVNTQAYKAQRMTFQESMYITSKAGSDGTASQGGNNPSQVGYGASVGSIDLNMSPGTFSPTGYDLDCMLDGEGFFIVGDKETGEAVSGAADLSAFELTRMGDFWVDPNGYVCDRRGKCVYGYSMVQNPNFDPSQAEDPKTNPRTIVSTTRPTTPIWRRTRIPTPRPSPAPRWCPCACPCPRPRTWPTRPIPGGRRARRCTTC